MSIEPPAPSGSPGGDRSSGASEHRKGAGGALGDRLLERLRRAGARGLSRAELVAGAGGEPSGEAIDAALAALRAAGGAAPWRDRWRAAETAGWLRGRVVAALPGGGARVSAGVDELAVGSDHLGDAAVGDAVLVQPLRGRRRLVAGRSLAEGAVVAVLGDDRGGSRPAPPGASHATRPPAGTGRVAAARDLPPPGAIVGAVVTAGDGRTLAPFDARRPDLPLEGAGEVPAGHFVVAAPEPPPRADEPPARARVIDVLGDPAVPGVDAEVVLRHYRIPSQFPQDALAEAAALPDEPRPEDLRGRLDLRGATVVTIDGADARDFDDALSVEEIADGWRLGVHIADVSHYAPAGGALDREAERRGTSVYFPGRVVPMLPAGLSDGLCSLRPAVPRLTVSVFLEIDRRGAVRRRRFATSVIASARRLTYAEVARVLEDGRPADARDYGPALPLLGALGELMAALNRRRAERGSLDFDLPEGDVELDTDGTTVGVQPSHRTVAHRVVEEAMIAANEAVAGALAGAGAPALYRVHPPPGRDDLEPLAEALEHLGVEVPWRDGEIAPAALAAVQRAAAGEPWQGFVDSLMMRALRGAVYAAVNSGHFALASRCYTHFTSPIRRYPDLVVHRRLKELIREGRAGSGAARGAEPAAGAGRLASVATAASEAERRATRAERDLLQWKKVRFLAGRVGETFPGRITGVQPYGLFVQLERYLVDGLVPVRTLGREYFRYDPAGHRLVGDDSGSAFRLADPVTVRLAGVSHQHRGLDLELA